MELKKPVSFEEQVQRLIAHEMEIADTESAHRILSEINYYRFIGYAFQFKDFDNPDDYMPGTKFETVWRLYQFDSKLRNILKPALELVELHARMKVSYGFAMAKCKGSPHDQHYISSNFHNAESHNDIITASVNREKKNSRDSLFVIHHEEKYEGKMPLWVIVELLSFTNLSKLFNAMYYSEQNIIAESVGTTRDVLRNHLHCMANLRNKVAHASRLYNTIYNPPANLGRKYLQRNPNIRTNTLFAYLIVLMRRLPRVEDKSALALPIINEVQQYDDCVDLSLLGFPENYKKLLSNEIEQ